MLKHRFGQYLFTGIFILFSGAQVFAQQMNVLFIGNSFTTSNTGVDSVLANLSQSLKTKIEATRKSAGELNLEGHFNDPVTFDSIKAHQHDFVVLQEFSNGTFENKASFQTYSKKLDSAIVAAGAQTVLFMTWTYSNQPIEMIDKIAAAYISQAAALGARVAPVGLAWQRVLDETAYAMYTDDRHATFRGTYLSACVFYATITGQSPVGATYRGSLTPEEAATIQRIAWETVHRFQQRPFTLPAKIEAEEFFDMLGIGSEKTSDNGHGRNLGWMDPGDWMEYRVNVPESGEYLFSCRLASGDGNGSITILDAGSNDELGHVDAVNTGNYQGYATVRCTLSLAQGEQRLRLRVDEAGFNFNWFGLTQAPALPFGNRLVVFGSSVASGTGADAGMGYAALLSNTLEPLGMTVINKSIGGNKTTDLLNRFDADLVSQNPDYAFIGLSLANEGIIGNTGAYDQYKTNMQEIIRRCRSNGIEPVIGLCYSNNGYDATLYDYIKKMNVLIQSWDVASCNVLAGPEDGTGKWATGVWSDAGHPNNIGHAEMFQTIVPTLFRALDKKIDFPARRTNNEGMIINPVDGGSPLWYEPNFPIHSFTQTVQFRLEDVLTSGSDYVIATIKADNRVGTGSIVIRNGQLVYVSTSGQAVTIADQLNLNQWYDVAVAHRYITSTTNIYLNGSFKQSVPEQIQPGAFIVAGNGTQKAAGSAQNGQIRFKDWYVYRAAFSDLEAQVHADSSQFLQASLEVYAPLQKSEPGLNLAQSLSTVKVDESLLPLWVRRDIEKKNPEYAIASNAPRVLELYNMAGRLLKRETVTPQVMKRAPQAWFSNITLARGVYIVTEKAPQQKAIVHRVVIK
jgi:lysophospholipase L1-like esterase